MPGRIEDYALIGDAQTAALVGRDGSVDWLCVPRFDSPAVLAGLLGSDENGHWRIAPADGGTCERRWYADNTLVLVTEWVRREGTVRVWDFMPPRGEAPDVVRIVEGVEGAVGMQSVLRLRFDYGHIVPWVRRIDRGIAAVAGPDAMWLDSPVPHVSRDFSTYADVVVHAGERLPFVLTWQNSYKPRPDLVDAEQALADTEQWWQEWLSELDVDELVTLEEHKAAVVRSLITLKALTYAPTGGIVAAATTSLPETLGGVRNWDYRYAWLRDATFTLQALVHCGFRQEAKAWREWLLRAIAGDPAELQIMYGVAGERRLPEYELDWLPGYEGSRPVRVGNAAADQFQLDVYGEVMDALALARDAEMQGHVSAWSLQVHLMDWLEGAWQRPDDSLWEIRGEQQHFVHSKVLAWVAFDRAVRAIERYHLGGPADRWRAARDEIHALVCDKGYDASRQTFTQSFGSKELDAATLLIAPVGFLEPDDPRYKGTVDAVSRELSVDGLVRRYDAGSNVDGVGGSDEGAFLACSFWLADGFALVGRHREAHALFDRLLALRNDVGLLAEEYDPVAKRQLGNVPQAYSHVALINTALHLHSRGRPVTRRAGS